MGSAQCIERNACFSASEELEKEASAEEGFVKKKRHTIGEIVPGPALEHEPSNIGPLQGKKARPKVGRRSLGATHKEANFHRKELIQPRIPPHVQLMPFSAVEDKNKIRLLGKGGFGEVHEVIIKKVSYAVKTLKLQGGAVSTRDFIREVIVLGTVAHPNIVQLIGVASDEEHRCLIYELMEGGSLSMKIRDHNRLTASKFTPLYRSCSDSESSSESESESEASSKTDSKTRASKLKKDPLQGSSNPAVFMWYSRFQVILDACLGLACLHECTLLHCDIKPGNILIRGDGRAAVADFGLSRSFHGAQHKKNKNGYTPGYADPYWRHHGHVQTEGSDVYCMGLVMLQVITGYSAAELHKLMKPPSRVPYPAAVSTVEDRTKLFVGCVLDNVGWPKEPLKAFTNLACQCLVYDPKDRPNMGKILKNMSIMCEEWRSDHPEIDMMLRCQSGYTQLEEDPGTIRTDAKEWGENLRKNMERMFNFRSRDSIHEVQEGDLSNLEHPVGSLPGEEARAKLAGNGSPGVGSGVVHPQVDTSNDGPVELTLPEQDSGYVAQMVISKKDRDEPTQTPLEVLGSEEKRPASPRWDPPPLEANELKLEDFSREVPDEVPQNARLRRRRSTDCVREALRHRKGSTGSTAGGSFSDGDADDTNNPNRIFVSQGVPPSPRSIASNTSLTRGSDVQVNEIYQAAILGKHRHRRLTARQEFGTAW